MRFRTKDDLGTFRASYVECTGRCGLTSAPSNRHDRPFRVRPGSWLHLYAYNRARSVSVTWSTETGRNIPAPGAARRHTSRFWSVRIPRDVSRVRYLTADVDYAARLDAEFYLFAAAVRRR
jgi:hypothetical protein